MSKFVKFLSFIPAASALMVMGALFLAPVNAAEENPFHMSELSPANMLADSHKKEHKKGHKMKMMDTDGDGSISKDEFMAHAEKKFAKKDKNGDGILSAEEMKKGCGCKHGKCKYRKGKHGKGEHGDHGKEKAES